MYRTSFQSVKNQIRVCTECKKEFIPRNHGGKKMFCSQLCANRYTWKHKVPKPKVIETKTCIQCDKTYEKNAKFSKGQWNANRFCSIQCANAYRKIDDGMTTPERCRRKKGQKVKGSPEWVETIKARTKEGMMKPEVREKLQQSRQPMSYEGKIIRSEALAGKMPQNLSLGNGSYSNVQRGEYECSKGSVYFRSKWEANYALFLDYLIETGEIKNWEYEADVLMFDEIKLGTRSYRPDFKIFNNDGSIEYHEVKGYMDARSKTQLKRMAKYYPEIKLVLIERAFYMDLLKKMKNVLRFY